MAWTYTAVARDQAKQLEAQLLTVINGLTEQQRKTFKACASDRKGGDARGIIIFDTESRDFTGVASSAFAINTFSTGSDYTKLYNNAVNFINTLNLKQAQNARVVFTNAEEHDATIAVYYPVNV